MSASPLMTKLTKKRHLKNASTTAAGLERTSTVGGGIGAAAKFPGHKLLQPQGNNHAMVVKGSTDTEEDDTCPKVNFPPRKRSIPYGFDFDLDEVWAPLNPHLRGALYNKSSGGCSSGGSSTTASSSSEVSSEGRPMKSVLGEDESRAPTARLFGRRSGSRSNGPEDSAEEFAVENEDIFMQINNLTLESPEGDDSEIKDDPIITNLGLPSARTLRGGASIVAKGRHEVPNSAMSYYSNYSSSSSRFSSGSSPTPSRRLTNGLTPGLVSERRGSKAKTETSGSVSRKKSK